MLVAVTGAEGFIGSHLVEELLNKEYRVRAMVRYNFSGDRGWLIDSSFEKWISSGQLEVVFSDLIDRHALTKFVEGCDYVVNAAALIGIPYSYNAPRQYFSTNLDGILNLMDACLMLSSAEFKKLVHISTSEVYGSAQHIPMSEAHPKRAQSPYAASKIAADAAIESYARSFGLPTVIARPFNTYGPRQSTRAVIPSIMSQALQSSSVKIGRLDVTRDFTYVTDTVGGIISCMECYVDNGRAFNLGTGDEWQIALIVREIGRLMDKELSVSVQDERMRPDKSEVLRLVSDNSELFAATQWAPAYSGLDGLRAGLERTYKWMRSQKAYASGAGYAI